MTHIQIQDLTPFGPATIGRKSQQHWRDKLLHLSRPISSGTIQFQLSFQTERNLCSLLSGVGLKTAEGVKTGRLSKTAGVGGLSLKNFQPRALLVHKRLQCLREINWQMNFNFPECPCALGCRKYEENRVTSR